MARPLRELRTKPYETTFSFTRFIRGTRTSYLR
jgi:hypothetical protein